MIIALAWASFVVAALTAFCFGYLFWYRLLGSGISEKSATRALMVYTAGTCVILALMLAMPL